MDTYTEFLSAVADIDLLVSEADTLLSTQAGREKANVLTRAGIVLLTGYLEGYIRDVIGEFVNEVNALRVPIDVLPDPMVLTVLENATTACRSSSVRIASLKRTASGSEVVSLDPKHFTNTGGNPTVETIESLFASVGVPEVVEALTIRDFQLVTFFRESPVPPSMEGELEACLAAASGDVTNLRRGVVDVIERRWLPKRKRRAVGYVHQIQQLLKKRNRIAHGEGREPITPLELSEARDHVVKLASGLADLLSTNLDAIRKDALARSASGRG